MKKLILIAALLASSSSWGACISGNCTNGIGTVTYPGGSKYVGEWKDGKKHGQGTYTWPFTWADERKPKTGVWVNDYYFGTKAEWDAKERTRKAKEEAERKAREEARQKYDRIYN